MFFHFTYVLILHIYLSTCTYSVGHPKFLYFLDSSPESQYMQFAIMTILSFLNAKPQTLNPTFAVRHHDDPRLLDFHPLHVGQGG
jgi:hypothetical protein